MSLNVPLADQVFPFDQWRIHAVEHQVMDRSWRIDPRNNTRALFEADVRAPISRRMLRKSDARS